MTGVTWNGGQSGGHAVWQCCWSTLNDAGIQHFYPQMTQIYADIRRSKEAEIAPIYGYEYR